MEQLHMCTHALPAHNSATASYESLSRSLVREDRSLATNPVDFATSLATCFSLLAPNFLGDSNVWLSLLISGEI